MTSLRRQILTRVEQKLDAVLADLAWKERVTNPREPIGEDQMNTLVLMHGGDVTPSGLTGDVEQRWLEFSVGWLVLETAAKSAEVLLDEGYVAIHDALLDPADIQLAQLAIAIRMEDISDPMIGRSPSGARIVGGQAMDFRVQYLAREGDAASAAP